MRLWPTTPMLARETTRDTDLDGVPVPAGSQILIVNTFNHRDREAVQFADRLAPEAWLDGDAAEDWYFNHLSHGPQGCPGAGIALFVGKALLAALLRESEVQLLEPTLDPARPLPQMLDYFGLKFELPGTPAPGRLG
jgi:cytochrome P450